jgi:hypothetical protein
MYRECRNEWLQHTYKLMVIWKPGISPASKFFATAQIIPPRLYKVINPETVNKAAVKTPSLKYFFILQGLGLFDQYNDSKMQPLQRQGKPCLYGMRGSMDQVRKS